MCVLEQHAYTLTFNIFSNGVCEGLNTARQVPGILLDVEAQLLRAVHLGLHLLLEL